MARRLLLILVVTAETPAEDVARIKTHRRGRHRRHLAQTFDLLREQVEGRRRVCCHAFDGRTPGPHTRGTSPYQSKGDTWIRVRGDRIQSVRNGHWLLRGKYVLLTHISNHSGGDPLVIAP